MNPINLFKGYKKGEDEQTHSFLSFLNFLKETNEQTFLNFCVALNILNSKERNIKNVVISCFPKKLETGRVDWDGQMTTKSSITAIESKIKRSAFRLKQIKVHIKKLKDKKLNYRNKKLILLTPFDKDWLIHEYPTLKNEFVDFLSWSAIYSEINNISLNNQNNSFIFVLNEYKNYVNEINEDRVGIIQTLNMEVLGKKNFENLNLLKEWEKWHVPSKNFGFDLPNFNVFLYKHGVGLVGYFNSRSMSLNPSRKNGDEYKFYFNIQNGINVFPSAKIISKDELINLLGKREMKSDYEKFKRWKNRGHGYFVLNKKMIDALLNKIQNKS